MINWEEYQKKIDNSLPNWTCADDYQHLTKYTENVSRSTIAQPTARNAMLEKK